MGGAKRRQFFSVEDSIHGSRGINRNLLTRRVCLSFFRFVIFSSTTQAWEWCRVLFSLSRFFFKFYFFRFPFLRLMFLFGLLNELTSGGFISPDDGWPTRPFLFVNCCAVGLCE